MPVAGPVGLGTLALFKERGTGMVIGVDTDWAVNYPDDAQFILASALKNMDKWVTASIVQVIQGTFKGEQYLGTLENGGVGLGISAAFADKIPAEILAEIEQLKADINAGKIKTVP
jgi:basic membrane protein A